MRAALMLMVLLAACGGGVSSSTAPTGADPAGRQPVVETSEVNGVERCADVVDVRVVADGDRTYTFHVTVRSADEGWDKYADEWTVQGPDGELLGTRTLLHPHVDEQPFTRSLSGVEIAEGIKRVMVAARDSVSGYCGATFEVDVP